MSVVCRQSSLRLPRSIFRDHVFCLALIATLVYEWYIARVALAVTGAQAALIVVLDVLLSEILFWINQLLY